MKKAVYGIIRLGFGVLGLYSITYELIVLASEGVLNIVNFFSYFTILSNFFAALFLIYYSFSRNTSRRTVVIRGAVTLYMIMTGVIFTLLLAGLDGVRLTAVPINNIILHYIMPIVLALDWLVDPPRTKLSLKEIALWTIVPIAYVIYTLVRGAVVDWYPYPFFNPGNSSYAEVIITLLAMTGGVIIAALLLRSYTLLFITKRK